MGVIALKKRTHGDVAGQNKKKFKKNKNFSKKVLTLGFALCYHTHADQKIGLDCPWLVRTLTTT